MGNLFSRYWYTIQQENGTTSSTSESNNDEDSNNITGTDKTPPSQISQQPEFDTPQSYGKHRSRIFAAYVPDSAERYSFQDFDELKSFLSSPVGKKRGTRFKPCEDEKELESFYNEQLSVSTCTEENNTSSSSIEPDLPYKEIPARRLTEFRMAIEKHEHTKFDELLKENPRFLVNTSNDLPTIVHIGTRYNALHIACRSSNLLAVKKILSLIMDRTWLTDAYATSMCVEERSENLLNAMLNTPDKIENNTPLHYACKFANVEIVETLLNFSVCNREPVNSHNEVPIDLIGLGAKNNKQEAKEVCNKILCAYRKEPTL